MLGKKGGEAQIYRIVLAQVSSGQEGRKTIDKLYAESENKHTSSALGDKQIVFVECLASVTSASSEPGPGYSGNESTSIISEILD